MNRGYELRLAPEGPTRSKKTGRFLPGHRPHNKNKKWEEWMSADRRAAMRERLRTGMPHTGNMSIGGCNKRPIVMMSPDMRVVRRFDSSREAESVTGIEASNIRKVCHGKRRMAGGFRWEFYYEQ